MASSLLKNWFLSSEYFIFLSICKKQASMEHLMALEDVSFSCTKEKCDVECLYILINDLINKGNKKE